MLDLPPTLNYIIIMRHQFPIDYPGTKFIESGKHLNAEYYAQYNHIVEPYGGTFGFSRWLYASDPTHPRTFTVCDNNEDLINTYNMWKAMTRDEFISYIQGFTDAINALPTTGKRHLIDKALLIPVMKEHPEYDVMWKYNFARFTYRRIKDPHKCLFWYDMLQKTTFLHESSTNLMKYDELETMIYIDPPYIMQCNSGYVDLSEDYVKVIHNAFNDLTKANAVFIHSRHSLLTIVFGKYVSQTYSVKYGMSRRATDHDVFVLTSETRQVP